tara:strand:+ start:3327 stop:3470 length:144 start_codon:yes stop_codon:yes gene_type:complete
MVSNLLIDRPRRLALFMVEFELNQMQKILCNLKVIPICQERLSQLNL